MQTVSTSYSEVTMFKLTNLEEVAKAISDADDLAFDTETVGLYGKVRLAQFYQKHWPEALLVESPSAFELLHLLTNTKANIVMQNAAYDVSTIQENTGCAWIPGNFSDTLLLARLALPQLDKYSLDELVTTVLGFDPYLDSGISKADMHKAKWDVPVLPNDQLLYSAIDVYYLLDLYDHVKHAEASLSYKVDIRALRRALHFQRNGMYVAEDRLQALYRHNIQRVNEIGLPINANSYKQVRPYIGSDQSDDLGLALLSMKGNTKAAAVRETRKLLKLNSFLNKFDVEGGRIYGHFAPSARSGRFTCKDQNLQQLPRASKGCFGAPEGRVLLFSDYPQLELRTAACLTQDAKLCELLYAGEDTHNHVAELTFGPDWTKDQRQVTKTENFNLLYGGGAGMLQSILLKQADMWLEESEIRTLIRKWRKIFPGIVAWQERGTRDYNRGTLGSTPFGRQYKAKLMTDQLNIANQGMGADVAKLAMHYMYDDLLAHDAMLVNFIHDSYIIEMDDDPVAYEEVAKRVAEAMKDAWSEASKMTAVKDLPMPIDIAVGHNWGDIEKGEHIYSLTI